MKYEILSTNIPQKRIEKEWKIGRVRDKINYAGVM